MKNGYTPKEYAHSIAIDALHSALRNNLGELDGLTPKETEQTIAQMNKLMIALADKVKMDITPVNYI